MSSIKPNNPLEQYIQDFNDYARTKGNYVSYGQISLLAGIAIGIASYFLLAHGIPANHFSMSERIIASIIAGSIVTFIGIAALRADYAHKIPGKIKKTSLDKFFEALIDEKTIEELSSKIQTNLKVRFEDLLNQYPATNRNVFVHFDQRQDPDETKKAAFTSLLIADPLGFMITHYERPNASGFELREELIKTYIPQMNKDGVDWISKELPKTNISDSIREKISDKLKLQIFS